MNNNQNSKINKKNQIYSISQTSFFKKLKNKIVSFFKFKPKIYLLGTGKSLEIDGVMPPKPLSNLLNKFGSDIDNIAKKPKQILEANQIKNPPEIYSNALTTSSSTPSKKSKETTKMLNKGMPNTDFIIPEEISSVAQTSLNSDSRSTLNISTSPKAVESKTSTTKDSFINETTLQEKNSNSITQINSNTDFKDNYIQEDDDSR